MRKVLLGFLFTIALASFICSPAAAQLNDYGGSDGCNGGGGPVIPPPPPPDPPPDPDESCEYCNGEYFSNLIDDSGVFYQCQEVEDPGPDDPGHKNCTTSGRSIIDFEGQQWWISCSVNTECTWA